MTEDFLARIDSTIIAAKEIREIYLEAKKDLLVQFIKMVDDLLPDYEKFPLACPALLQLKDKLRSWDKFE